MSTKIKAGTATSGAVVDADATGILELQSGSTPTTAITVDASQNVGIGTASPSAIGKVLNLYGSAGVGSSVALQADNGAQFCTIYQGPTASDPTAIFSNNGFKFATATAKDATGFSERMRIDSSGNLLVGNTSGGGFTIYPSYSRAGSTTAIVNHITGSASGESYFQFQYAGTGIGSITQTGTTAVLYNTTSDYRLKTDVTPIQNALATVKALNPVNFTWVDGRKDDGFLAHEIQAVIPNCVTGEKDAVNEDGTPKYQQMDNSGVIPFLVKAIQELNAKVDAQAAEIKALKGVA